MALMNQLYNKGLVQLVFSCHYCKANIKQRFHCTECKFDLCIDCRDTIGHDHELQRRRFVLGDNSACVNQKRINPQESRRLAVQRCVSSIEHASHCRDVECSLTSCRKLKIIVSHTKTCKVSINCEICNVLVDLNSYHAENCQEPECLVPFCWGIESKLKKFRMAQVRLQNRLQPTGFEPQSYGFKRGVNNIQQLPTALRFPRFPQEKQLAKNLIKSNPQLLAACIIEVSGQPQTQQPMQKPKIQMMPGAPNRIIVMKNVANGMSSNVSKNMQSQNMQPQTQQPMQKPTIQMMPGAPNRIIVMRNVANGKSSNVSKNMQPQNMQPQTQQPMPKPTIQMMPGAPNRIIVMRNVANGKSSNVSENIQPQNRVLDQPMQRSQSQMTRAANMPQTQQPMQKPTIQMMPGAPNRIIVMRNVANGKRQQHQPQQQQPRLKSSKVELLAEILASLEVCSD